MPASNPSLLVECAQQVQLSTASFAFTPDFSSELAFTNWRRLSACLFKSLSNFVQMQETLQAPLESVLVRVEENQERVHFAHSSTLRGSCTDSDSCSWEQTLNYITNEHFKIKAGISDLPAGTHDHVEK